MGLSTRTAALAVVGFLAAVPCAWAQNASPSEPSSQSTAAPSPAAWATQSAAVSIQLSEDGAASVRLDYVFVASPTSAALPLTESIPVQLLGFGNATVREVRVDGAALVLWPTTGSHREAAIRPSRAAPGTALPVSIEYVIPEAVDNEGGALNVRVPLVTGPPGTEGGSGFTASVEVPVNWAMSDGFPSGLRETDPGVWEVSLPVVPSVVRIRGAADGGRRLSLPLVVDALALLLLLGFAAFGWRHLRRVVREARA